MSARESKVPNMPNIPPPPKVPERDTIPREVKNEIENLRRLAQHIQDRLHALAKR